MSQHPEQKRQRILAERAERLARAHELDREKTAGVETVVFEVGQEQLAIPVEGLREVIELPPISALPGTPPWILGITQVRGELFAVADLGRWMGLEVEIQPAYLALIESGDRAVGLTVERVVGGRSIETHTLGQPAAARAGKNRVPIRGVTPDLVTVLDPDEVARSEDLVV